MFMSCERNKRKSHNSFTLAGCCGVWLSWRNLPTVGPSVLILARALWLCWHRWSQIYGPVFALLNAFLRGFPLVVLAQTWENAAACAKREE